ncbi:hypothetical protein F5141DRAFT_1101460 [Pisolithus sp. B1]|nr:hypothetical protein F5141DRAFT_1101460 [Pisolithus sp. B1]
MPGLRTALKKVFNLADSSKLEKIYEPTPPQAGGTRAYADDNIRIDHGLPGTGNRVVQVQSQTKITGLKRWVRKQKEGSHAKVATVKVEEGGKPNLEQLVAEVVRQVS